jgi:citrate lyase beta subunit
MEEASRSAPVPIIGVASQDTGLDDAFLASVDDQLAAADRLLSDGYPGDPGTRQPVHTVYIAADQVDQATPASWGAEATTLAEQFAPDAVTAGQVTGLGVALTDDVYARARTKLAQQPVEDLRIDLEDGYGFRPDAEEDAVAAAAAGTLARLLSAPAGPSFGGIRFKSLARATRRRGLRSLDLFITALHAASGPLPDGLLITLPKVSSVDHVIAMTGICQRLEQAHNLPSGRLRFEIQVETPQAILGPDGTATIVAMVHAAGPRAVGLHYGTYDYSAACGIAAEYQSMDHPVADHAKAVMQVAAAGTGVRLSDGSTNVIPVGSAGQVRAALALHARLVTRSLQRGYYQGWDMHPGHLLTRYLATYAFYRQGFPVAARRLSAYLSGRDAGIIDEPATAQALGSFITRGLDCGALDEHEVQADTGVPVAALHALAQRRPVITGHRFASEDSDDPSA